MTKEEALQYEHYFDIIYNLSQTCGVSYDFIEDKIKQAITDAIAKTSVYGKELGYEVAHDILSNSPITPSYNSIKTELEPCEELDFVQPHKKVSVNLEPCDDCISRTALLDKLNNKYQSIADINNDIIEMPSVNPVEKIGHWIYDDDCREHGHCSECGYGRVDLVDGTPHNYCRDCGCKMKGWEG